MLSKRLLIIILLAPLLIGLILVGSWPYYLLIAAALGIAAWEFWRIYCRGNYSSSLSILIVGVVALVLARGQFGFDGSSFVLSMVVMVAMAWHLIAFEHGQSTAAVDFAITLAGVVYLGWLGSYLISLRDLPDGQWWLLLVLLSIWIVDSGAFLIGRRWGHHKMTPVVSPNKSWEGYMGGVVLGAMGTAALASVLQVHTPHITTIRGLWLGLTFAILTPLGDLGESMIKRQFGVKDSSNLLPGHGGIMDRIDSWLWTAVLGFYLITWFF
jgi:phosphatidate cytidylyltransferase